MQINAVILNLLQQTLDNAFLSRNRLIGNFTQFYLILCHNLRKNESYPDGNLILIKNLFSLNLN